ncbi:MAG: cell wall metabolism sensor histidine kinase WalK [Bacteroidales bacterium]|nr:cell wall metabolism sensor histidine kinase WalK [Clostridium sp.]MCM1204816.1 cell wall metabolism sensor histidine kinase WalK [Bacteroidales bacterium]
MIRRFKYSLRFKLTMMLMVMMAFTIFASLIVTQFSVKAYFLSELKNSMVKMYKDINIVFSSDDFEEEDIRENLSRIAANNNITFFVLYNDGATVYTNTNEQSKMRDSMQSIANLLKGTPEEDLNSLFAEDVRGYHIFHRNYDEQMNAIFYDLVGVLNDGSLIALRSSATRFNESVSTTMKLYTYVGILAIIIGCIAMFFASSFYVKPIHEMAVVAKKMSQLDFDARVDSHSRDEIGELGNSINSMSKELEATISELKTANAKLTKDIEKRTQIDEMRKEFLSHVSHELKTPIALIQGYAEGLKENISDDVESRDFYCEVIMDEADRMNSMVKKLLALNELEFGTDKINVERFDIVELMKNINASSEILLQQNKVTLHFDNETPLYVWGDEFMIEEVYTNYLTNAIHYTPEGGNVYISMEQKGTILRINVFNEGSRIPEDELEKIWIKFYKVDKARTREYGGSGIGLSIVAATMKLHGRDFGAYNRENGVVFYFELEEAKQYLVEENS